MTDAMQSNLDRDGERRAFAAHGHAMLGSAGGVTMLKGTFEPGWRWSQDVKPIAGTDSCQVRHLGYTGALAAMTDGRFRADLIDVHGDGRGHVIALHQITATRGETTRVTKGSILFSFLGDMATDLLELRSDLPGDDVFFG